MRAEKRKAREQAERRAAADPRLTVFEVQEDRRLPISYYAAETFSDAVAMYIRGFAQIGDL